MTDIFTESWVDLQLDHYFDEFSNLSNDQKRIQYLIFDKPLPYKQQYRIYKKGDNIVIGFCETVWKFVNNRFFTKSKYEIVATITPKRIFTSDLKHAFHIVSKHLGFEFDCRLARKPLLRQMIKKGQAGYYEYMKKHKLEIDLMKNGYSFNDVLTYTDNPEEVLKRFNWDDYSSFCQFRDLLHQAKQLNKIIKMSWSDRKMHDMHMKWTEEIQKIKSQSCSIKPIWKNLIELPKNIELLNSEKRIANEGTNMHHCIFTNYSGCLLKKRMVAFHVYAEDSKDDFTCSFNITESGISFDQAYKAWNKSLSDSEKEFAKSLIEYVDQLCTLNEISFDKTLDLPF